MSHGGMSNGKKLVYTSGERRGDMETGEREREGEIGAPVLCGSVCAASRLPH